MRNLGSQSPKVRDRGRGIFLVKDGVVLGGREEEVFGGSGRKWNGWLRASRSRKSSKSLSHDSGRRDGERGLSAVVGNILQKGLSLRRFLLRSRWQTRGKPNGGGLSPSLSRTKKLTPSFMNAEIISIRDTEA